jgi:hypothetical protein
MVSQRWVGWLLSGASYKKQLVVVWAQNNSRRIALIIGLVVWCRDLLPYALKPKWTRPRLLWFRSNNELAGKYTYVHAVDRKLHFQFCKQYESCWVRIWVRCDPTRPGFQTSITLPTLHNFSPRFQTSQLFLAVSIGAEFGFESNAIGTGPTRSQTSSHSADHTQQFLESDRKFPQYSLIICRSVADRNYAKAARKHTTTCLSLVYTES